MRLRRERPEIATLLKESDTAVPSECSERKRALRADSAVRTVGPGLRPANFTGFIRGVETPRSLRKANSRRVQHLLRANSLLPGFPRVEVRFYSEGQESQDWNQA